MGWFTDLFANAQEWLFNSAVQPLLFSLGMANLLEDGYEATAWLLAGVLQIMLLLAIIGPLQRWRPVEPVTDRATIRTDILYTLIHRLGVFRIALFFALDPWFDEAFGALRTAGYGTAAHRGCARAVCGPCGLYTIKREFSACQLAPVIRPHW